MGVITDLNLNSFHFHPPHPPLPRGKKGFTEENYLAFSCQVSAEFPVLILSSSQAEIGIQKSGESFPGCVRLLGVLPDFGQA